MMGQVQFSSDSATRDAGVDRDNFVVNRSTFHRMRVRVKNLVGMLRFASTRSHPMFAYLNQLVRVKYVSYNGVKQFNT